MTVELFVVLSVKPSFLQRREPKVLAKPLEHTLVLGRRTWVPASAGTTFIWRGLQGTASFIRRASQETARRSYGARLKKLHDVHTAHGSRTARRSHGALHSKPRVVHIPHSKSATPADDRRTIFTDICKTVVPAKAGIQGACQATGAYAGGWAKALGPRLRGDDVHMARVSGNRTPFIWRGSQETARRSYGAGLRKPRAVHMARFTGNRASFTRRASQETARHSYPAS